MQNVAQCKIARLFIIDVDGATVPYYSYSNGLIVKHQLGLLIKHEVHICTWLMYLLRKTTSEQADQQMHFDLLCILLIF